MSDTGTTGTPDPNENGNAMAELREAADRGRTATAENDQLKREMAFLRAGIDDSTPLGKMFVSAYDGELTAEAIRAAALEVGAYEAPKDPEPTPDQLQQQTIRDQLQGGGASSAGQPAAGANGEVSKTAQDKAREIYDETVKTLGADAAREEAFASVFAGAATGVPGAVFNQAEWNQKAAQHPADPWAAFGQIREAQRS